MRFRSIPAARSGYRRPGSWLVALPFILLVALTAADLVLPEAIHLAPLLVIVPALAATVASPMMTGLSGALAVGAVAGVGSERGRLYSENLLVQLGALTLLSLLLVVVCMARERRNAELDRVRAIAEATQRVLLRPLPSRMGALSIASHYRAAEADARIGGDLYAVARTFGATRLIIGDVSGRGLASISETAMLLGAFRAAAHRHAPLPELMAYLEGSVRWGLTERAETPDPGGQRLPPEGDDGDGDEAEDVRAGLEVGERFVTAAVVEIPDDEQCVRVVNCGHPPPLLVHDGLAVALSSAEPSPPLGLGELLDAHYEVATHRFQDGDVLLLYTDGLSEARDRNGVFYPLTTRLPDMSRVGPEGLLAGIAKDVRAYTGRPLDDDLAMVAVERSPVLAAPG